ncbi:MAG TPA: carboxypeptidase regulatory-like domain-containing protein [Bryobacteraceae bacterium]|nr:carboxypeptidase regulatory-like domain-containing protein [Bryobacteraceae bacterium]
MNCTRIFQWCLVACLLSVSLTPLGGQTMFGRISGTITDPSGAVIPGARVTVTNTDTQALRTVNADEHGFYVVETLTIGPYRVAADQPGFNRATVGGVSLVADGHVTVDLRLNIGPEGQMVDVVAGNSAVLNTVSAEISQVVDRQQIENLGLNGRNYMELLTLVPGAVITNPDQFSVMTTLSATNQSVNGHRTNSNNMTVDGLGNLDGGANGSLINNISPDFTQEVKIQTSNFSAEYGRSSGVAFNLVTKNGSNQFHGSAFEYFRNDALDARNFFAPDKTALRFNDFGYDLGGPIKKNKVFFFVGQEWKRLRQATAPIRVTLPSSAELQGNFVGSGKTIDQPGTKTPYPGNIIPATQLTTDGKAIANVYRFATSQAAIFSDTPTTNNATFEVPNPLNYREDLGRVDYRINDKHTLYGRWVDDYNSIYLAYGPGSVTSSYLPIVPEIRDRPGKSTLLTETWVVSSNIVNDAHVGASWNGQRYWNQGDSYQRSFMGFTFPKVYNSVGPYPNGIPDVNVQNFEQWKGPDQTLTSPTTQMEAADTISFVHGAHTIRAGASVIRYRKDQNGRSNYDGSMVFNTSGNPNTTGYALADALLQTYTEAAYDPEGRYRYTEPGAFIDESWKATRKLTVNLGLRYEYMMALYSTVNNLANFVPSLYNPAQAVRINASGQVVPGSGNIYNGLQRVADGINPAQAYLVPNANDPAVLAVPAGAPRGMYPSQNTWAPRAGLAYAVDSKTVIRTGFGLFYDRIQGNPSMYTLNNPPYVGSVQYQYGNLANIAGGAAVSAPWGTLQTMSPNLKIPYSEQFSFGIQRDLPLQLFVEADYVGSLGRHLLTEPDINQPAWNVLGAASSTANVNTLRPFAGYSVIQQFLSAGTSNYHALQVKVERRLGKVQLMTAYTFSKNLSDASSDTDNNFNYYNLKATYGPAYSSNAGSSIDVRHALVGTVVWYLPELTGRQVYVRLPFGGWQLSSIIHVQSGFYYTVTGSTALLGTRVADYIGGPGVLPNAGPNGWFNPAAFVAAPQGRFGSAGTGDIEGPGLQIYNLSLSKFFLFGPEQKISMRFRADFLNAFNCVNFQSPATTITSSGFGTISSAYPPRNVQLGLKLSF